jgi:DNA transformation protein
LSTYRALEPVMGPRHDPCVLYTLLAVQDHLATGSTLPWWRFTDVGRALLTGAPA